MCPVSLDQFPVHSKLFYFQLKAIICCLFGVYFMLCDAGLCCWFSLLCLGLLLIHKMSCWSNPLGQPHHHWEDGGSGPCPCRRVEVLGDGWTAAWCHECSRSPVNPCGCTSPRSTCAPLSPSHRGSSAVIKHPIRNEPFPSAPSLLAYSPLLSLFLVESFSYKWYLCNLARMFWWAGLIVHWITVWLESQGLQSSVHYYSWDSAS